MEIHYTIKPYKTINYIDKEAVFLMLFWASQLYSILETKHEQVIAKPGRLVTNEIECNALIKRMEVRMNTKTE